MPKKKVVPNEIFDNESDDTDTEDEACGDKGKPPPFSYEHKLMIIEAIAPHVKALFGKLQGNYTQARRKELLHGIMAELRSAGVNVGNDKTFFTHRIIGNMKRKTRDKLKLRKTTGAGFVPLSGLDKKIVQVFNLNGLHATGLRGHKDPPPRVVKSTNFLCQKKSTTEPVNAPTDADIVSFYYLLMKYDKFKF